MENPCCIALFTFEPKKITDFLDLSKNRLPLFKTTVVKTRKDREFGQGYHVTIYTTEQMLRFLAASGAEMTPYYKSVCPRGHILYSNAQMNACECPNGVYREKIAEEYFYNSRTDTA